MTLRAMDWVKEQTENSIYFVNITNHTNDELQKIIMKFIQIVLFLMYKRKMIFTLLFLIILM